MPEVHDAEAVTFLCDLTGHEREYVRRQYRHNSPAWSGFTKLALAELKREATDQADEVFAHWQQQVELVKRITKLEKQVRDGRLYDFKRFPVAQGSVTAKRCVPTPHNSHGLQRSLRV